MKNTPSSSRRTKSPARKVRKSIKKTAAPAQDSRAGRPTSTELDRRKAKVMQEATALFLQHGYAATSLVDIAKAARVATRTLYQHFGDKEAIFLEVVTAREAGAIYAHPSIAGESTTFDALMRIAKYICDVSLRPKSVDLMRLMIAESRRFPDFTKRLCEKTFTRFRANVAEMFDELTLRKLAPPVDSAMSALIFVDLILGITPMLAYAGWSSSPPSDAELRAKIELFILGRFGPAGSKKS